MNRQKEAESLRARLAQLDQECHELRENAHSIAFLSEEIDRQAAIIQDREHELNQWRSKYIDYNALNNRSVIHFFFLFLGSEKTWPGSFSSSPKLKA